jgi:hypothetical protein
LKKKGVNLDLESIKAISGYQKVSLLDVLDIERANNRYLNLFEKFKMDQRVNSIKNWLTSNKWISVNDKVIKNVHYIGKFEIFKTKEEVFKVNNPAVSVPENLNFEKS